MGVVVVGCIEGVAGRGSRGRIGDGKLLKTWWYRASTPSYQSMTISIAKCGVVGGKHHGAQTIIVVLHVTVVTVVVVVVADGMGG